jgi:hypothetical protein
MLVEDTWYTEESEQGDESDCSVPGVLSARKWRGRFIDDSDDGLAELDSYDADYSPPRTNSEFSSSCDDEGDDTDADDCSDEEMAHRSHRSHDCSKINQ